MSFDLSSIFFILVALMALQPLLMGRWYALRRAQAIRAIEKEHGTRVITMIHRQEKRSLFGFAVSRHIDLEDAQTVIAAIKETPDDTPIDLIIHTPGGLVLAAMQIARAVEAHPAKVTAYVPVYAMSGGTLIALAADEIVMALFLTTWDSFPLKDAIEIDRAGTPRKDGKDYLTTDADTLKQGKIVFADNCASCHSGKRPNPLPTDIQEQKQAWRERFR